MVRVAVMGNNKFVLGFQMAGIRDVIETEDPEKGLEDLKQSSDIGIIIIDELLMDKLDQDKREDIEDSVNPVFIPVSVKVEQDSLKRLIKKSIGVDLWN
jgi:vacuolar-type H+-ATPase subunit F/Vma7